MFLKYFFRKTSITPLALTFFLEPKNNNLDKNLIKINKYWSKKPLNELVYEADKMFEEEKYLEVYELLNRMKYNTFEVKWRLSRCLFKLSKRNDLSKETSDEMIKEAYDLITDALKTGQEDANVHKWMAIITDVKCGIESTQCRVKAAGKIKEHLIKAYEINPNDVVILYMLGKWCFEMSRLTFFQRILAKVLYAAPPKASYEEAYFYFKKAVEVDTTGYYIPNIFLLGETCIHLKKYFRATYYLKMASLLPARSQYERECVEKAKQIVEYLNQYDLNNESILFELPIET